jgi:uncharacterized protein (DUF58 family)
VVVLLAWGLVAHGSGSGWVQAVGDTLAGALAVGLIGPAVVLARARLRVFDTPIDGTAGLPLELPAASATRLRVRAVDPGGPETFVGPRGAPTGARPNGASGRPDGVALLPARRGAYGAVTVELATAAPIGLMWWSRRVLVELPRPLLIAPRLGTSVALSPRRHDADGQAWPRTPATVGEPRGVRPYRPGDHRGWAHWPATAHTGELMVREMEGPASAAVTVEVRLPSDSDAAERAAERAYATVTTLLDRGVAVVLATTEAEGPRHGAVGDRRSAGRRLARAIAPPATTGNDTDAVTVRSGLPIGRRVMP